MTDARLAIGDRFGARGRRIIALDGAVRLGSYQGSTKDHDGDDHMKALVVVMAALFATSAFAQSAPPMVGDKPLVQIKPKASSAKPAKPGKPQSIAVRLQACLEIEDGTKGRLDCYDTVFPPKPAPAGKPKPAASKAVADCRFNKEEDARLACYNDLVERLPKLPTS
jgi:hypothetical protein